MLEQVREVVDSCPALEEEWLVNSEAHHIVFVFVVVIVFFFVQGVFFHWYPPKKSKYGKPRLGESTLT